MHTEMIVVRLAKRVAEHRGLALSTVSTYAGGDGKLVGRLIDGHDITTRRAARIVQWFSDHWPGDLPWPPDIRRPDPSPGSPAARALESLPQTVAEAMDRWFGCMTRGDDAGAAAARDHAVELARMRPDVLPGLPITDSMLGMIAAREKAMRLDERGRARAAALCELLNAPRYVYDAAIRHYAEGKPKEGEWPSPKSQVGRMVAALVEAGDVRFQGPRRARRSAA